MQVQTSQITTISASAHISLAGKYLVFELGKEEFAVGVLKVREIMGIQAITSVPHTPSHFKGVINLRGKIIPVLDLRLKFGLPAMEYNGRTCIIVVSLETTPEPIQMGIVVDGVVEVLNLADSDIEKPPHFGHGADTGYLLGMAKFKGRVKMLLDIEKTMSAQDLSGLSAMVD
jgi:purine-binding chemotaxis protein CheW